MISRSHKSLVSAVVLALVLMLGGCHHRHFHFPGFESRFELTVSFSGSGSGSVTSVPAGINCGAACVASFSEGAVVTLTANAAAGSTFLGWAGACSGTGVCSATMGSDQTAVAIFALQTFTLTVARSGSGGGSVTSVPAGISCGAICVAQFSEDTVVALTASAAPVGSAFLGWTGACSGTGVCSVTMDSDQTVGAIFALQTFTLTVARLGGGSGVIDSTPGGIACGATCSAIFPVGAVVTLSSVPSPGSTFDGWSGACSGIVECVVTVTSALNANATFSLELTPSFHSSRLPGRDVPEVLYTDALSGPIAGGENNLGAYFSIYGRHFGSNLSAIKVYIGGAEVANYRGLGAAVENGIEQITVQVGPLANVCTPSTVSCPALPVIVCVSGRCSDVNPSATFTPNTGQIFFVSFDGDDLTAAVGDVRHPFRTLQNESPTHSCLGPATETDVYARLQAGDHVVIRGGDWSDVGRDRAWLGFCDAIDNADSRNDAPPKWIHITSYPGELVRYTVSNAAGAAFRGSAATNGAGRYVSFSNLEVRVDPSTGGVAWDEESGGKFWRVVNSGF